MDSASFVHGLLGIDQAALGALVQSPAVAVVLTQLLAREVVAPSEVRERAALHEVVTSLASAPGSLSFLQLSLYAGAFQSTNAGRVAETVARALAADVLLAKQVFLLGPQQLVAALAPSQAGQSFAAVARGVRVGLALARSCPSLSAMFGASQTVLRALATAYSTGLSAYAPPAIANTDHDARAYLALRLEVLETAYAILAAAFVDRLASDSLSPAARSALWDDLTHAVRPVLDALPPFPRPRGTPLVDRTLLGDLHHFFHLGDTLHAAAGMATERRDIADQIRKLEVREVEWDALEAIRAGAGDPEVRRDKGKGKAVTLDDTPQTATDTSLTLALSQILDVLPDLEPVFLTACLAHPRFGRDPEQVVAALLEDDLPPELRALRDGPQGAIEEPRRTRAPEPELKAPVVPARLNVFDDDDQFDAAKLRRGKSTATADLLLADRSYLTDELKAAIIERAERESSDEDVDSDGGEESENLGGDGDKGFKVRDGEDGEDDGDEAEGKAQPPPAPRPAAPRDALANPITGPIAKLLELAYISDPTVFDRTSAVKRSQVRADLRARSGLADEQLEGWRAMLERNPKKDKILARHEFAGNRPARTDEGESEQMAPQSGQAPGQASRDGRGGGEGSRGGRGGARGGGRGKSDGGRAKSNRRTRGADRKMAKVA